MLNTLTSLPYAARLVALSIALTIALPFALPSSPLFATALAQTAASTSAGSFPSRPVKIITPYSTGIAPDDRS